HGPVPGARTTGTTHFPATPPPAPPHPIRQVDGPGVRPGRGTALVSPGVPRYKPRPICSYREPKVTMRKKFWSFAAAALGILGGVLAVNYPCDHPASWFGHFLFNVPAAAVYPLQAFGVTGHTAGVVVHGVQAMLDHGSGACCPDDHECDGPHAVAESRI